VSRYDHPSAAAAPGTPVLATALEILSPASRANKFIGFVILGLPPQALCYRALRALHRDNRTNRKPDRDRLFLTAIAYF
jgi:hypothetical protein